MSLLLLRRGVYLNFDKRILEFSVSWQNRDGHVNVWTHEFKETDLDNPITAAHSEAGEKGWALFRMLHGLTFGNI